MYLLLPLLFLHPKTHEYKAPTWLLIEHKHSDRVSNVATRSRSPGPITPQNSRIHLRNPDEGPKLLNQVPALAYVFYNPELRSGKLLVSHPTSACVITTRCLGFRVGLGFRVIMLCNYSLYLHRTKAIVLTAVVARSASIQHAVQNLLPQYRP